MFRFYSCLGAMGGCYSLVGCMAKVIVGQGEGNGSQNILRII